MNTSHLTSSLSYVGVIVSLRGDRPSILVDISNERLPTISFSPDDPRSLEVGFRNGIAEQFGINLEYVEQLYTFGNRGRDLELERKGARDIAISYLGLIANQTPSQGKWKNLYEYLPWEDHREGFPTLLSESIMPDLKPWSRNSKINSERTNLAFGSGETDWNPERVHDRFEILFEAGLLEKSNCGSSLYGDHRRIVASALSRIRGKIRYRPIIFELVHEKFTLYELQLGVEALSGVRLHKQNFRRLLEKGGLVEPVGEVHSATGGRPALLYRFRKEALFERPAPGIGPASFPIIR